MENKLKCEIVQDLLPSYVDGLTSNVTNEEIKSHIESCEICKNVLRRMQEPEPNQIEPSQVAQIDYLKNTRKKSNRVIVISFLTAVVLIAVVLFIKFYCVGSNLYSESIVCNVDVTGSELSISGTATNRSIGIAHIAYEEENGVVTISVRGTLASLFHKGEFQSQYTSANEISQVRLGDRVIWDKGVRISANTSTLYMEKNPYVGDMSANMKIAMLLGIHETLGHHTHELQTQKEPYGWTLVLEDTIFRDEQAQLEEKMKSYGYVILATVENLGYVIFEYDTEDGEKTLTITTQDATTFAGQDIKLCYDSPAALQKLMEKVKLQD